MKKLSYIYNYLSTELSSIGSKSIKTIQEEKTPIKINSLFFHGLGHGETSSNKNKFNNNKLVVRWKSLFKDPAGKETVDLLYNIYDNKLFKIVLLKMTLL